MADTTLFDPKFQTARPPRPVYCHQEFLDKLAERRNEPVGKRAALLMQRMAVDIARLHYKATSGVNRGWRRSRLGGSSGSHFYAWWAPAGAPPVKEDPEFGEHGEAIFLRDIRHHDNHDPLTAGSLAGDYMPLTVYDLRHAEYAPEPWTAPQLKFARGRGSARVLKGHPGSGKTTALLHAADQSNAEKVLYLTFSQDLAAMAREYFDRYCSAGRTFTVLTYPEFVRQLAGWTGPQVDAADARAQFRRDLANYQRAVGPWAQVPDALYDEMYAHLVGAALPETVARFPRAEHMRLPDAAYRQQRQRYLGPDVSFVMDAAHKLERPDSPLADRYFPELAVAWRAAQHVGGKVPKVNAAFLEYGCIAVDEVQDLTPLECYVTLALTRHLSSSGKNAQLLLAGDEAQTVRPTDFEWAWLNDMLHGMLGQHQEFKLPVNLRSPRQIAELVNRTWDFYDYLDKHERPSGTGYAEIDDEAPNQIFYVTLAGNEMGPMIADFSQREGLAMIAFDKSKLPKESLPYVLSPQEAKGLDFQSICVINGGALIDRITGLGNRQVSDSLERRLMIDQLRVAVSRPTERLIWADSTPTAHMVTECSSFLSVAGVASLPPITLEALQVSLGEEELGLEERIQRCRKDALQLVGVKPDLAWSRAQQAVALLGKFGDLNFLADPTVNQETWLTLGQVCFLLAIRRLRLSPELGNPDLWNQAAKGAQLGHARGLADVFSGLRKVDQAAPAERLNAIAESVQRVSRAGDLPAWFTVEFAPRASEWVMELERNLEAGDNPVVMQQILPPFLDAMGFPDAAARKEKLAQRSLSLLMKARRWQDALTILERTPDAKPKLLAECYEETGQFAKAAEIYLKEGERDKALRCYRSAPDFAAALTLVRQMAGHAAKPSLEWLAEMDAVLQKRPENFNRVMTMPEKKILESMLERGLGVQRKKPAPKKKGVVNVTAKKAAPKKAAPKPKPPRRRPPRELF